MSDEPEDQGSASQIDWHPTLHEKGLGEDPSVSNIKNVQRYKEDNMFSGLSKTTLKNSANFNQIENTKSNDATNIKQAAKIENLNFIIIESLKQKRDSVASEHTKSNKSTNNNEFLHVFSAEFLTKEEIERNEKTVNK